MRRSLWFLVIAASAMSMHALAEDTGSPDDEARRSKVFAKVGPTTITVGDLDDIIAQRSPYARRRLGEPELLKEMADAQVESELFYQGALALGYADDPKVRRFVDQTLVKVFVRKDFEEAVSPDEVPEERVIEYYEEHPDEFRREEMRRARHIVVGSKKESEEILELLRKDEDTTFRALAKQRSLDTETKVRGGDLLYFTLEGNVVGREAAGKVDPTLAKAAFGLATTGERTEPLDLGDGKWSVLELTGIRPERVQTLEQAKPGIRRKLWREEREAALDALIARLRTELEPEVHPERLDAIVFDSPAAAKTPAEPAPE